VLIYILFILHFISWFQNVILANRACGGGLVAWKGTNQTDAPGNRYGAYISDSQIIRVRSSLNPSFLPPSFSFGGNTTFKFYLF
jgi:hypothetical protein